jgi:hypothetical protein
VNRLDVVRDSNKGRHAMNAQIFDPVEAAIGAGVIEKIRSRWEVYAWRYFRRFFKFGRVFRFGNRDYKYFFHEYNTTWRNERAIEIPIIMDMINELGGNILEVGNVLSHYFEVNHDIVDKYEKGKGLRNEDVTEIKSVKKYDLIVSISTFEHVGWDEGPTEDLRNFAEGKILAAIDNLKKLLSPKGRIVITVPLGYNPELDELIDKNLIGFSQQFCFKRISKDNRWVETKWSTIRNAKFNHPYPFANAIIIGLVD